MPGGRVVVDRLVVRVTGMDPIDAQELARAIASRLAPTLTPAPGEASLDRLRVEVEARPGETWDALAARAARQLAPLLNRVGPAQAAR
ncbi:MAG: hypothetical protein ABSH51_02655 [Solirubrobacteraceae bacterium]|jgi:hypothetical protein